MPGLLFWLSDITGHTLLRDKDVAADLMLDAQMLNAEQKRGISRWWWASYYLAMGCSWTRGLGSALPVIIVKLQKQQARGTFRAGGC